MRFTETVIFAQGAGHLDRAQHLRGVAEDLLQHRRAALLPQWKGRLLIAHDAGLPALGWVPPLPERLEEATDEPVFLGLADETPCFTADFSELEEAALSERFGRGAEFRDLRAVASQLSPGSAGIAATAKGVVGWHLTHPYCARCGAETVMEEGGWRRRCTACQSVHFPRTDPVVIMLVLAGDEVLVGRQPSWPPGLFSLLAGYMEPGETIEDAVRRETYEETRVRVGRVRYLTCQPWPFPSSLMLGCVAEAISREIVPDPAEIEEALWISRAKMQVILAGQHPRIAPPRIDAIARVLLDAWCAGEIEGL